MKSLSNAASGQARSFNGGEAVRSGLPILGTGVLVWVLSGGFPPTTWVFLFQAISQLNSLFATQGIGAIGPLTILIVQSLFLAAAWGLLGWIILREGAYLVTMQSKAELDRLLAFQSSTDELIKPSQILQLPEQGGAITTDQLEEKHALDPTTEQLEEEQRFSVTTGPLKRRKDFSVTTNSLREQKPEQEVLWASRRMPVRSAQLPMPGVQSSAVNSRNVQLYHAESLVGVESRNVQSRNAQPTSVEARNGQSRNAQPTSVEARNGQSRNVQPASVEARNGQSRNAQPASVEARNVQSRNVQPASVQSRRTSHLRQGLSTRNLREEDLLENPFDKDVPPTSEAPVNGRWARIEKVVKEEVELEGENENEEDDSPFVFGNPFDGPLPEVFKYDAELRRSVPELVEEGNTGRNGSKAKGTSGN